MRKSLPSAFAILTLAASQASAQNLLKNPGFEDPPVSQGSALGVWFLFDDPDGSASHSSVTPHGGASHIELETIGPNQFAGVFQTLEDPSNPGTPLAISPGQHLVFRGFHRSRFGRSNATSELKVEWTGAPQNRLDELFVFDSYTQFTHQAVAPPGTTGATITYAISSFGAGQGAAAVWADDFEVFFGPIPPNEPLAAEPFDYAPTGAVLAGMDGGTGFAGPWSAAGFNASVHTSQEIASGSLSFAGVATSGNRAACAATPAIAGLGRALAAPIAAGATVTLYFGFLVRPEGTLGGGAFNGFFGVYLDGAGNADLFAGKPGSDVAGEYVIEDRGGSGQVRSSVVPVVGETALLVVRADLRPGLDRFTLFVNPAPCGPEPSAGVTKTDLDLGDVSAVVIYSTGAFSLDEVRLGPSFASVVPRDDAACRSGFQLPSDCNQDGDLDISDGVCLLNFLFGGARAPLPCGPGTASPGNAALLDANGDLDVDLSDAVRIFGYLFLGLTPPVLGTSCIRIPGCSEAPSCID